MSENESVFDPMELVRNDEPHSYKDEYEKRVICEATIKGISQFDYSSRFYECDMNPNFRNSIKFTRNYIYMEKFEYQAYFGKKKYLDFIMTYDDLTLLYIRFYSEDESDASFREIESALKNFSSETEDFYKNSANSYGTSFAGSTAALFYDYWTYGLEKPDIYTLKVGEKEIFEAFSSTYIIAPYLTTQYYKIDNSPFYNFWIISFIMSMYEIELGIYCGRVNGIGDIASEMDNTSHYSKPSYSVMNGRIYQSVYIGLYQIVVIYNIKENCYEGLYAPQGRNYGLNNNIQENYGNSESEYDAAIG